MYLKEDGKKLILFYCGHQSHFNLVKNTAKTFQNIGNKVLFANTSNVVLSDLFKNFGFYYPDQFNRKVCINAKDCANNVYVCFSCIHHPNSMNYRF